MATCSYPKGVGRMDIKQLGQLTAFIICVFALFPLIAIATPGLCAGLFYWWFTRNEPNLEHIILVACATELIALCFLVAL